jgi:hypothetical protein
VTPTFGGALVSLGYLAARLVRDLDDNRTNPYLLALAGASVGKDRHREPFARPESLWFALFSNDHLGQAATRADSQRQDG